MVTRCSFCGAPVPPGETCRERFDATEALELEHPDTYGSVHHLSVAAYMLQHNVYSREGWLFTRRLLYQFVYEGLTPQQARRQNRRRLDSGQRALSVTWGPKLAGVEELTWTRTIADVRTDTAEHYCADVCASAVAVLADTEQLVRESGDGTL